MTGNHGATEIYYTDPTSPCPYILVNPGYTVTMVVELQTADTQDMDESDKLDYIILFMFDSNYILAIFSELSDTGNPLLIDLSALLVYLVHINRHAHKDHNSVN